MIQLTKLSKALNNGYVAWIKKNNHDYIISSHFILKINQVIKGSALTKLITLLGTIPNENQGIQSRHGHISEMAEDEIKKFLDLLEPKEKNKINFTNLLYQKGKELFSIFKGEEDYISINKIYTDLVDLNAEDIEIYGKTKTSSIYFRRDSEEVMLLPVRLKEVSFYLK